MSDMENKDIKESIYLQVACKVELGVCLYVLTNNLKVRRRSGSCEEMEQCTLPFGSVRPVEMHISFTIRMHSMDLNRYDAIE